MLKPISRTQRCLSLGALLLTHCNDGGDATSPEGSAGAAPTAGTTSTAGTAAAQAGQAGASATAGSPPTAGSSTGGAGGGSAGTASGGSASSAGNGGAVAGGGGGAGGSLGAGGAAGGGAGGGGAFKLTSSEHAEGAVFADALTCAGVGRSPALAWTAGPTGTKSYAITFLDETLVAKNNANGYHWVIWDIPAATLALPPNLPAGATLTSPVTAKQFSPANGFDKLPANAYFGPCPNAIGDVVNTDTYAFTLYALSVEQLTGNLSGVKSIEAAIKATTPLATTALHGTSMAKPN
jgi:Raf kinase inhibitor-like YbhB/YbcL family protein